MSTPNFCTIKNTEAHTFSITGGEGPDYNMVYISSVSNKGKDLTIKTLCVDNKESIKKDRIKEISKISLACLHYEPEGWVISGHKDKMKELTTPNPTIHLISKGKKITLGKISTFWVVEDSNYKNIYIKNLFAYLKCAERTAKAIKAERAAKTRIGQ